MSKHPSFIRRRHHIKRRILSYRRTRKSRHRRHQRSGQIHPFKNHCSRALPRFRPSRIGKRPNPGLPGPAPGSGEQPHHLPGASGSKTRRDRAGKPHPRPGTGNERALRKQPEHSPGNLHTLKPRVRAEKRLRLSKRSDRRPKRPGLPGGRIRQRSQYPLRRPENPCILGKAAPLPAGYHSPGRAH